MGTFGVKRASDEYFCPSTVDTTPIMVFYKYSQDRKLVRNLRHL